MNAVEEALAAHKEMNQARRADYEARQADFDAKTSEEVLLEDWAHFERNPRDGYLLRFWQEGREPWLGRGELDPDLKVHQVIVAHYTDAMGKRWTLYIWRQANDGAHADARRLFWKGVSAVRPLRWEVPEGLYK